MANWSHTYITLTGDKVEEANEYLNTFIKDGYLDVSSLMSDNSITSRAGYSVLELYSGEEQVLQDDSIVLNGQGRWCAPHTFIKEFAKKFKLSGNYTDEECR